MTGSNIDQVPDRRSLWQDACTRFFRNRAAVASLAVLALVAVFALFGNLAASWSNEEIDWSMLGNVAEKGAPSLENGHYFGVDELGRDLFARAVQGGQVRAVLDILGWRAGAEVFSPRPFGASYSRSSSSLTARI